MKRIQKGFWEVDEWAEKLYDELAIIKKTGVEHIPSTITIGGYSFMVIKVAYGVEKKKVDEQGRFVLPPDWRMEELKENNEVFVINGKGYLKIVPKKKVDLTKFFDTADLGRNIEDWTEFERRFYNEVS